MQTTKENGAVASKQHAPKNTNHGQNYNLNRVFAKAPASVSSIEQALAFIDATDRATWINCGMGIKSELGESVFDVCDRWSSTADNYSARTAAVSWRGFNDGGGITIATVFGLAKDNGYRHNSTDKPAPLTPEDIAQREAKRIAKHKNIARKIDPRQAAFWEGASC